MVGDSIQVHCISPTEVQYFKLKFRFINYEFDICGFIAFQAFLRRLKKSLSGG